MKLGERVRDRGEGDGAGRPLSPMHLRGVAAAREVDLAAALANAHREAHALARAAPPTLRERRAAEHDAEPPRRRHRGAPARRRAPRVRAAPRALRAPRRGRRRAHAARERRGARGGAPRFGARLGARGGGGGLEPLRLLQLVRPKQLRGPPVRAQHLQPVARG